MTMKRNFAPFSVLHPYSKWSLKVRVSQKLSILEQSAKRKKLDILMLDHEGEKIQATIYNENVDRLKGQLEEGKVYNMHDVEVQYARGDYRLVPNQFRCIINDDTLIEEETEESTNIPLVSYNFIAFTRLPKYLNQTTYLIDVIGLVIDIGDVISFALPNKKETWKRDIVLMDDQGIPMTLTLWENFAINDGNILKDSYNNKTIIAATALLVKRYLGLYLSTSYSTRIILNPHLAEAEKIIKCLFNEDGESQAIQEYNNVGIMTTVPCYTPTSRVSIKKLTDILEGIICHDEYFSIKGSISRIHKNHELWYLACAECKKKIEKDVDGNNYCMKCESNDVSTKISFCVNLEIMDHTGSLNITLFDKAENLFDCSAAELKDLHSQENGADMLDERIRKVLWTSWIILAKLTKNNLSTTKSQISIKEFQPLDFSMESRYLLEEIKKLS